MLYMTIIGRRDDTVGKPHRVEICQFVFFEFVLLLSVNKQHSIEQVEPTVSQSTVSILPPPLAFGTAVIHKPTRSLRY